MINDFPTKNKSPEVLFSFETNETLNFVTVFFCFLGNFRGGLLFMFYFLDRPRLPKKEGPRGGSLGKFRES